MATFESMDRRMPKIEACLKANGLESLDACNEMLLAKGIDCDKIVRGVQPDVYKRQTLHKKRGDYVHKGESLATFYGAADKFEAAAAEYRLSLIHIFLSFVLACRGPAVPIVYHKLQQTESNSLVKEV